MSESQLISTSVQPASKRNGDRAAVQSSVRQCVNGPIRSLGGSAEHLHAAVASLPRPSAVSPQPGEPLVGSWLNRPRRVLLALSAVWIVAIFDLGFTLSESATAHFVEMNPVAARLLGGSASLLCLYKFSLLGLGTLILLFLRRHSIAELACWFLLATKVYLAVRWFAYFDCLVGGYTNPLIMVE